MVLGRGSADLTPACGRPRSHWKQGMREPGADLWTTPAQHVTFHPPSLPAPGQGLAESRLVSVTVGEGQGICDNSVATRYLPPVPQTLMPS